MNDASTSKNDAWAWWNEEVGAPRYVCAPMVDQSEGAFRRLVRRYGVGLAYSPMLLASKLVEDPKYRGQYLEEDIKDDEKVIVQLGGGDVETVVKAAVLVKKLNVVAVDLNLGCPQACAERGHFGAFLSPGEAQDLVAAVKKVTRVTCKMRVQRTIDETVALAVALERSGASLIAVHGRTARAKSRGDASWAAVRAVVQAVAVPVILNGNVRDKSDADDGLRFTGAAAVMSAEPLLAVPTMFLQPMPARDIAREYLVLAAEDTPVAWARAHVVAIALAAKPELARDLVHADFADLVSLVDAWPSDLLSKSPVRRDLLTPEDLALHRFIAAQGRQERHLFKSDLRRDAQNIRPASSEHSSQLLKRPLSDRARAAVDAGSLRLCNDCGVHPAKRSCLYGACRGCCARRHPHGQDCGNHATTKKIKRHKKSPHNVSIPATVS